MIIVSLFAISTMHISADREQTTRIQKGNIQWLNDVISCPQHTESAHQHHHLRIQNFFGTALSTYPTTGMLTTRRAS